MAPVTTALQATEITLLKLAREIAIDHFPIETILERNNLSPNEWERIQQSSSFKRLLHRECEAWQSATNTHERTKLKAASMMEEWLPEAYSELHHKGQSLNFRVELAKLIARIAGMGLTNAGIEGGSGERVSININLGADTLKIEKELPPKVIEGEIMHER